MNIRMPDRRFTLLTSVLVVTESLYCLPSALLGRDMRKVAHRLHQEQPLLFRVVRYLPGTAPLATIPPRPECRCSGANIAGGAGGGLTAKTRRQASQGAVGTPDSLPKRRTRVTLAGEHKRIDSCTGYCCRMLALCKEAAIRQTARPVARTPNSVVPL